MKYAWANVGAEVVCIDADWRENDSETGVIPSRVPMLNEILTIRDVVRALEGNEDMLRDVQEKYGHVYIGFEEVESSFLWHATHFKPLITHTQSDDIAMFQRIADKAASRVPEGV